MNYVEEALKVGFSNAAIIDTEELHFVPEYRKYCEENLCGCYDKVPVCPPTCGTAEELCKKAKTYEKALVLQTILSGGNHDPASSRRAKTEQNILTEKLVAQIKNAGKEDLLIMSAGPYKENSCISAYCFDAQKMAEAAGMECWVDDEKVRYFSLILYHE